MKVLVPTLPLIGSIAALWSLALPLEAQTYTWTSPVSGTWSNSANWLSGIAPNPGGGASLQIKFGPRLGISELTSSNDLLGNFFVNRLEFDVSNGSRLILNSAPSSNLVFHGDNSRITQSGHGTIVLTGTFNATDGITTVDGTGSGDIEFSSLEGLAAGDTLRIAVGPDSPNGQLVSAVANASGGTVRLDSGNLSLKLVSDSSNTKFRINGGTVRFDTSTFATLSSAIELGDSLVVVNPNGATISGAITSVSAGAGLQLRTNGPTTTLKLTGASTYTGPTVVDFGATYEFYSANAGTLRLAGNGSILNSSTLDIRANGTLALEALTTGTTNRVGNSTPIILRSGHLRLEGQTGLEQVGPVSVSGFSSLAAIPSSDGLVQLSAASLTRLQRGTVLFRKPTSARIFLNSPPTLVGGSGTGPNTRIIPYAIGTVPGFEDVAGFVTYDANGVRPLNSSTEYVSNLGAAAATNNVRWLFHPTWLLIPPSTP